MRKDTENFRAHNEEFTSIKEITNRLKKLYFYEKLKKGEYYSLHLQRSQNYFKIRRKRKPYLYLLASSIPSTPLQQGYRLLPLHSRKGGHRYFNFVQVPKKITDYNQIKYILKQLIPLDKRKAPKKEKEQYFAYILGMMVSDISKPRGYRFSHQSLLALTRRYLWSLEIGNYLSAAFQTLGIRAHRIKDNDKVRQRDPYGAYRWITEKSPFITYLLETCLGLKYFECTTYHSIRMNWLF
mgnify:FL=1